MDDNFIFVLRAVVTLCDVIGVALFNRKSLIDFYLSELIGPQISQIAQKKSAISAISAGDISSLKLKKNDNKTGGSFSFVDIAFSRHLCTKHFQSLGGR
jgi:hypothetical protein